MTYAEYQQAQRIARSEGLPIVAHRFSGAGEDYGTDAGAYTLVVRDVEAGERLTITSLAQLRARLAPALRLATRDLENRRRNWPQNACSVVAFR